MKDLFLPYELALIAKQKGFNEPCIGYFAKNYATGEDNQLSLADRPIEASKFKSKYLAAPLYQQIIDWLREKHNIDIVIDRCVGSVRFCAKIIKPKKNQPLYCEFAGSFMDYYETLNKAIEEAFKLLPDIKP